MVPKELTEEQKQRSVTIFQDILERQDHILGSVITGDETWVYQYDPETKRRSAQWKTANSPRPKKTAVYNWMKRFAEGRENVSDGERSGRPATSRTEENIAKIR